MKKIFMAMISGKSKEEVYDMLTDSEKEILFGIAQNMGMSRVERRKMKRKYERKDRDFTPYLYDLYSLISLKTKHSLSLI